MFHDSTFTPVVTVRRRQKQRPAVRSHYKLDEVAAFILAGASSSPTSRTPFQRIALQFPDDLLEDAIAVTETLKGLLAEDPRCADGAGDSACGVEGRIMKTEEVKVNDKKIRLFVVADNTFGSCCPDEITAQHYGSDCIIHFGDACMSRSTRIPVFYVQDDFRFSAFSTCPQEKERVFSVRVVLSAVKLLRCRLNKLCCVLEENGISAGVSLIVLGSHRSRSLLGASACHWRDEERTAASTDSKVLVEWCSFDRVQAAADRSNASFSASTEGSSWVLNGVRFPRAGSEMLQYFLFVGSSNASLLIHILNVHQYNLFHYPEELREMAFTSDNPHVLTILDEDFGRGSEAGTLSDAESKDVHNNNNYDDDDDSVRRMDAALKAHFDRNNGKLIAIQTTLSKRIRQRAFNLELIRCSSAVGIIVASLAIEGYYETTILLHQLLRAHGKRAYIIYIGHLNKYKIANFVDTVDCFVSIACPNSREGHFPAKEDDFPKTVVSPIEVLVALRTEDGDSPLFGHPALYNTTLDTVLPLLREAMHAVESELAERKTAVIAVPMGGGDGASLIRASAGVVATQGANGALHRLYERSFVGLDPKKGQTPVQEGILEGRHGIARGYASEREQQEGNLY
ncbi:diphthamide synthesis protein, putative [Trypanosoma cruzi marinkellei]|uniref:Diphthamide synthesis protein, putative n=1 Tax=Trypanosoma cruzi marinkellei TaxID=85056 RepID=K2MSA6_TRYCR|nr:diphthamide synthesis protein, putative [Trypanosoma cruzi marinkellei]